MRPISEILAVRRALRLSAAALVAFALGCDRDLTAPEVPLDAPVAAATLPGSITWLAPLGTGTADPATFDDAAAPRVEICAWVGGACSGATVAAFATVPASGVGPLTVNAAGGEYSASWSLLSTSFTTRRTYRIRALQAGTEIGAVSVDVIRGRWALTRTDGTLAPLVAANALPIRFHVAEVTASAAVRVNEVESNLGSPGDWIELHNTHTAPVSLAGYVIKDNDDTHAYTFPAGAMIAAGGFLAVEESALDFGLGAADAARFFAPGGATLVDSYAWTAHAPTTYGRCPDWSGDFQTTTVVTKGAANDCSVVVRINEVESNGDPVGDFVELYNPGPAAANLSGYVFRDNDDSHGYMLPAGSTVPAGGYLVLAESAFGFGLGGADNARLLRPGGTVLDAYEWTAHATTTYGRCPNGTGAFTTTASSTRGTANACGGDPTAIRINEIESNGDPAGDWVELYNTGTTAVDLSGWVVKDNDDTHVATIPAGTSIPAGGYHVVDESVLGFGLGTPDAVRLYVPGGTTLIDSHSWTPHAATTYGRCPNGTGAFATTTAPTRGAANDCAVIVRINEIESSATSGGDWVELYNAGPSAVSLAGYVFRDNADGAGYVIPAGTTIAAGGYLVLAEGAFGFGLGAADAARLFAPGGTTLVDSHTWTAHATTTYGRCPNGTGAFTTTASVTQGAANDCGAPVTTIRINEIESNGGTPGDWVELYNTGASAVDLTGWVVKDNDDTHAATLPAGASIAAGGYYVVEESVLGFGLGTPDAVRLYAPGGTVLIDTHSWTPHAATSYGRCPNATGAFTTQTTVTKGAANDCSVPVRINEVESNGDPAGDWVELFNPSSLPLDVSGFVFRDNADGAGYVIPAGTSIPANGYLVLAENAFGFGLGGADSARLFGPGGTTLLDSYTWTAHASTTYGRCPNGTGPFTTTTSSTRGATNACPGEVTASPWPGAAAVQAADAANAFGGNMSGLTYEGSGSSLPGVLWASRNGPGTLFRLLWNGSTWASDTTNDWGAGKALRYPDGTGNPDAEGVAFANGSAGGMYVATERNNDASGVSRNAILRFDPSAAGATLTAIQEWNVTADLPATNANTGLEAITWVPDSFLVEQGFFDESRGHAYVPAEYPGHGDGLFLVGVEGNGVIYVFALDHVGGGFTRVATIASGFIGVMGIEFDRELEYLWAICDDGCNGRSAVLEIDTRPALPTTGRFVVTSLFERPASMANLNNEGFAIAPQAECVADRKPVFWSDDTATGGNALRSGTVTCTPFGPAPGPPMQQ